MRVIRKESFAEFFRQNSWNISQISFQWLPIYTEWSVWHVKWKPAHRQCIDPLLAEGYKFLSGYSPDVMNNVFHLRQNTCNLQNFHAFATDIPRNNYLLHSVVYREFDNSKLCLFIWNFRLARIIQESIKKLVLHWCCICSGLLVGVVYI